MKKGFTMVELLAVIIIVGTVAILSFSSLTNTIKKNKVREQEVFNTNVVSAAKMYMTSHLEEFPNIDDDDFTAVITSRKLIDEKYLKSTIGNPYDTNIYLYYIEVTKDKNGYLTYNLKYSESGSLVKYEDPILNGADPELDTGMIPIYFENNKPKVANVEEEWYNYTNKMWANAVVVKESKRDYYKAAIGGTEVKEKDILGYFVWIPRYKYLNETGGTPEPSPFEIIFENKETPRSNGDIKLTYYSHPGFLFGETELNGFWIGKFETTGTASNPTILPNTISLLSQTLSDKFTTSKIFQNYGIEQDESRILKNSEWAATVYLAHSIYGINGEVRNNANTNYITGCSAEDNTDASKTEICINKFGENTVYPQSTTGNIYGVFDMAGCGWELVMGNYNNNLGESGFKTMPNSKYYDLYDSNFNIVGHALLGTQKWYNDFSNNPTSQSPWIGRGGSVRHAKNAGIFFYTSSSGSMDNDSPHAFRVVLSHS
jgi:prepilin-type N-terminal cleavage/methylation domain-containing protein